MTEDEMMRKYVEAHGCENIPDIPDDVPNFGARWNKPKETFRPVPCIRDEHGEIQMQTIKELMAKINEELDELKTEIVYHRVAIFADTGEDVQERGIDALDKRAIAEEAADTITAITTLLEALGIDAEMRAAAQRRVNEKNRERGRL